MAPETSSNVLTLQLQYAMEHFKFHAKQRTTMFHFFLIASGILANAIAVLISENLFVPAGIVALVGAFISLGFMCLDMRNAHLVKYGEHVLKYLEERELFKGEKYEGVTLGFVLREDRERETPKELKQKNLKHSLWLPRIQRVALVVFLAVAAVMFLAPSGWLSDKMSVSSAVQKDSTESQPGTQKSGS